MIVTDSLTIARRDFLHWRQRPWMVIVNLLFPVLLVLMFGYLLGGGIAVPGGGNYREYLMPGIYAMTMAFGLEATFTAVATDAARGVTDRFRSLPMSTGAVVVGRCAADMASSAVGLLVLVVCGTFIGWTWHRGLANAMLGIGLLLLLRLALLWVGIYLGLIAKGPESVVTMQILVWPLSFLSNAFVSPGTMPGWLGTISEWNPLSATVSATRDLFGNPGWGSNSWATDHALLLALAWPLLTIAVFLPLSIRAYRRLGG